MKRKFIVLVLLAAVFWIVVVAVPAAVTSSTEKVETSALALVAQAEQVQVASEIDSNGPYRAEELASVECKVNDAMVDFAVAMVIGNEKVAKYKAKNDSKSAIFPEAKKTKTQRTDVNGQLSGIPTAMTFMGYERAAEIDIAEMKAKKKTMMTVLLLISPTARTLTQINDTMPVSNIYS